MASEFNADDILEVSTSGFTSGFISGPVFSPASRLTSVFRLLWNATDGRSTSGRTSGENILLKHFIGPNVTYWQKNSLSYKIALKPM